jgi:hypothetical protein
MFIRLLVTIVLSMFIFPFVMLLIFGIAFIGTEWTKFVFNIADKIFGDK